MKSPCIHGICLMILLLALFDAHCQNSISPVDSARKYRSIDPDLAMAWAKKAQRQDHDAKTHPRILLITGVLYTDLSNYDSAQMLLNEALIAFQALNDSAGIADAYHNMGVAYEYQSKYQEALTHYEKGLEIRRQQNDQEEIASALNNIGNILVTMSDYNKALDLFLESLKVAQALNNKDQETDIYNNIGMVYDYNNDLPKALEYYLLAKKGYEELNDASGLAGTLNNIGLVYKNMKEPQKAIPYYEQALALFKSMKSTYGEAVLLNNLGVAYGLTGNQHVALKYHQQALDLNTRIGNRDGVANSNNSIGECYLKLGDFSKGRIFYSKGLELSRELDAKDRIAESLEGLSKASEGLNDYRNAFRFSQEARVIRDSIFTLEKSKKLYEVEQKYESAIKEKQIQLLNAESQKQKSEIRQQQEQISSRNIQLILVGASIILMGIATYLFYSRMRLLQAKKLADLKNEKEQAIFRTVFEQRINIAKDMHDEIGSGLTHIAMLSELMSSPKKGQQDLWKDANNISETSRSLIQSMSEIIWAINPKNDTLDSLVAYLREQTTKYFEPFDVTYQFRTADDMPNVKLTNLQRRNLFLVTKETLNNSLKHARASNITLDIRHEGNVVFFEISDNGQGFDPEDVRLHANGLRNMKSRMEEVGGEFNITSSPHGTKVSYRLPLSVDADTTIFTLS